MHEPQVAVRHTAATARAAAKPSKAGNCSSIGPAPPTTAPFTLIGVNQGMAESQQVPVTGPFRGRELVPSATLVDKCYVACTAYAGGAVPFYFQLNEATGTCSCCSGVCTMVLVPGTTVRCDLGMSCVCISITRWIPPRRRRA